jgi:spore germination cell wall hydrolase CwlJ-like protein
MSVVLNRVESEAFPDTSHEVITQESQFCAANKMKSAEITAETHLALCEIEKGNVTPKIIAFGTPEADSELQKYFTPAFTYKDHIFYTEKH